MLRLLCKSDTKKADQIQLIILTWMYITHCGFCAKILFLPIQQASHTTTQQTLVSEMLTRGHEVHIVLGSQFGEKYQQRIIENKGAKIVWFDQRKEREYTGRNINELVGKGSREILKQANMSFFDKTIAFFRNALFSFSTKSSKSTFEQITDIVHQDCANMFEDAKFLQIVKNHNFDLMIVDYWHPAPCPLLLPYNLSVPYILQTSIQFPPWLIGEPDFPSFVPIVQSRSPFDDKMTFLERLTNLFQHYYVYKLPLGKNGLLLASYAPAIYDWDELAKKAAFFISTRDHILEWPQPTMPNHLRIFGTTFRDPKPLTEDLQVLVNGGHSKGVIVLSFGSMGGLLPLEVVQKILSSLYHFSEYTVIFAYSGDTEVFQPLPKHITVLPWIPQNDILAHGNTKLFITHGGHNGQTEAVYHGVPMIVMPLFFPEQFHNAHRIYQHKYGERINFYDFTEQKLTRKITRVLTDNTFRNNVKKASAIVRDIGKHPASLAAEKIEQVLQYGSKHLETQAVHVSFYQYIMLDIVFFLATLLLLLTLIVIFFIRFIFKTRLC